MAVKLSALHIYPVKGLKGIGISAARCTDRGLRHDRRWMVVDEGGGFLSQREHPRMATIWTDVDDERLSLSAPDAGSIEIPVGNPGGATRLAVTVWGTTVSAAPVSPAADAWLSDYLGLACRLVYMPEGSRRESNAKYAGPGKLVGFADGYAYLIANEQSLGELNARLAARGEAPVPMNRFRPNLVVTGAEAFAEDGWKELRIGEAVLGAAKPCGRCQVTTTDQTTGDVTGPEPLATLSTFRESGEFGLMFGMNFFTLREGRIDVGDTIEIS
jgi:MOSC domain-containing protein